MEQKAILCVDDELIILMALMQEIKQNFGNRFVYVKATNADDALSTIEEMEEEGISVSLIISDLLMPGTKGDEFLEIVNNRYNGIKSILITGLADKETLVRIKNIESVLGILKKPWPKMELKNLIKEALNIEE